MVYKYFGWVSGGGVFFFWFGLGFCKVVWHFGFICFGVWFFGGRGCGFVVVVVVVLRVCVCLICFLCSTNIFRVIFPTKRNHA